MLRIFKRGLQHFNRTSHPSYATVQESEVLERPQICTGIEDSSYAWRAAASTFLNNLESASNKTSKVLRKKKSSRVLRKEQGNLLWSDYRPTRLVVSRGEMYHNKGPPSAERSLHSTNRRRAGRALYITRRVKKEKIKDDALESLVVV